MSSGRAQRGTLAGIGVTIEPSARPEVKSRDEILIDECHQRPSDTCSNISSSRP